MHACVRTNSHYLSPTLKETSLAITHNNIMYVHISFIYIYCQDTGSHPAANLININREIGEGAASDFSVDIDSQTKLLLLFDRTGIGFLCYSNMQANLCLFIYLFCTAESWVFDI